MIELAICSDLEFGLDSINTKLVAANSAPYDIYGAEYAQPQGMLLSFWRAAEKSIAVDRIFNIRSILWQPIRNPL